MGSEAFSLFDDRGQRLYLAADVRAAFRSLAEAQGDSDVLTFCHLRIQAPVTDFYRHGAWAQRLAEREFIASGGRTIYLGEWHTHPTPHARPSSRDRTMIREQFVANTLCTPYLLLVVALKDLYLGLFDGKRLWP